MFMQNICKIEGALTKLMRKGENYDWTKECDIAFEELKQRLTTTLALVIPEGNKGMVVYSNVSDRGFDCVLIIHGRVIACASR